MSFQLFMVAFQ